jgi:hypothetical protein
MDEAAAYLRKSRRWLQDWLRAHPKDGQGNPFFIPLGRSKAFRLADLERILKAAMEDHECPSNYIPLGRVKRRTGLSRAPTSESLWTEAQELLKGPLLNVAEKRSKKR